MKSTISVIGILLLTASLTFASDSQEKFPPLALHPDNPHYFLFRGKPAVLISSGEHYGAVLNLDFDYVHYLDALQANHLNHTRLWTGTYHEVPGAFGINDNTLSPKADRFICPWKRSNVPGAKDGGNKFDLKQFNPAYFTRLRDFIGEAGTINRNIVVEVNLFCPNYDNSLWNISPMNAENNINGVGAVPADQVYTLDHPDLLKVQEAVTRKIVSSCNIFDNFYFEVCNEPYFGGVRMDWQDHIVDVIRDAEKKLPHQHLISKNFANGSKKIDKHNPGVSIYNFHYCSPPDAVAQNAGLNCVIGENETGFKGSGDDYYRREGWDFILAGGALFDNLDYSFTTSHSDGTLTGYKAPGGGSPALRKQLQTLHDFIDDFDFVHMKPDNSFIKSDLPKETTVRALVEPGKQYAIYIRGGKQIDLKLDLQIGKYSATWLHPETGHKQSEIINSSGTATIHSAQSAGEMALGLKRTN